MGDKRCSGYKCMTFGNKYINKQINNGIVSCSWLWLGFHWRQQNIDSIKHHSANCPFSTRHINICLTCLNPTELTFVLNQVVRKTMLQSKVQISDLIGALLPLSTFATLLNPSPVCSFWQLNATFFYIKIFKSSETTVFGEAGICITAPPVQTGILCAWQRGGVGKANQNGETHNG